MVLWSCCRAARRHLIAVFRVVRSTRRASTVPERSLATWTRRLVRAASAAEIASTGVVLALGSSAGWVRPGHLEHGDTRECQVPGDAGSVGTGGFHSYTKQLAMRAEPAKHRPVAGSGGGERFGTKHRSVVAHNGGGVQVLVGVDATDDLDVVGCCSRHVRPLVYDGWRGWLRTQPMSDTTVTGRPRPGSHQVTMSVEVGPQPVAPGWPTCPGNDISVDLSVGQATQGRPALSV